MIVVENLYFSYKDVEILQNLNFCINSGKWISIIGGNGSGKSTLARILVGLLPILKGKVIIDNIVLTEENLFLLRARMGIIFQNPDYQFIGCDVKHDIAFGLENQNLSREVMEKKIFNIAQKLNILHLLDCNPQELSGGQKQLVAIASVLVMEPKIIIFDEPTSFLDPQGTQEIYNLIEDIHQNNNITLITITHDWEFAFRSDEIIFLQKGNLLKKDIPINFMKDEIFLKNNFIHLPLFLKLYYRLQQDFNRLSKPPIILSKLKDFLWQYNLKM
ncbi:energy-coupling factor ABC transporter ATP-binding protein [Candidatus Phytoplasma citri]|uniref:ATP-binding cassette domain-containing protein n=1 Tax=Candidatus Phytoplasma citri TaxID=180978 RepID=A0A1S9M3Q8_9MOLU|nr:ATP-binding cassette domain-containing protein [Candidatus Phytoplasma aurantifolia]MDO8059995.1 ATP-binding cassette domain-containing protein [Candidatus Phytoplasma aurantifolia]MDO8078846.1 ATP-binding cassette domain-containing protein [Candidatus Phytoplasma aurantifolia]OOP59782.1 energy-coupling factor transporter ATPase [Candidatus Phytoplasma aurantifolia]